MASPDIQHLHDMCTQVRRDILRMVHAVQSGHPGGALGCTEYFVALYFHQLRHQPDQFRMDGHHEDLCFLSNGHISPVWYSVLARAGYFPLSELYTFRRLHSRLQGHPATLEGLPGIRVATGSLGQGLSVAIGAAQAKKLNADDQLVYCLIGDGEAQEGQIWEAAHYAAHHNVDNLIVSLDLNYKQIDGDTRDVMNTDSLPDKFRAFGWYVLELQAANDIGAMVTALEDAQAAAGKGQPVMLALYTKMGAGVDFMEDDYRWHGVAPQDDELARALDQLPETLGDYPVPA